MLCSSYAEEQLDTCECVTDKLEADVSVDAPMEEEGIEVVGPTSFSEVRIYNILFTMQQFRVIGVAHDFSVDNSKL